MIILCVWVDAAALTGGWDGTVAAGPVVGAAPRGAAGGMFADMPLFVDLRQSTGGLMELGFSTDGADLAYMLSGGQ